MLVSTKSLDINIDFWGFDINLKVFLGTKLALQNGSPITLNQARLRGQPSRSRFLLKKLSGRWRACMGTVATLAFLHSNSTLKF